MKNISTVCVNNHLCNIECSDHYDANDALNEDCPMCGEKIIAIENNTFIKINKVLLLMFWFILGAILGFIFVKLFL